MGCAEAPKVHRLLEGGLSADETVATMDHVKVCARCRSLLQVHEDASPSRSFVPEQGPRYRPVTWAEVQESRSGNPRIRTRGFVAMIMVVLLTWVGVNAGKRPKPAPFDDEHGLIAEALAQGRAHPLSPRGTLEAWPRLLRAVLPADAAGFSVRISQEGRILFETTCRPGDPGVFLDRDVLPGTGKDPARELRIGSAPFPPPAELGLVSGIPTTWEVSVDGATYSPPAELLVTRKD